MDENTAERLLALNQTFYDALAAPFARSRAQPQPGFERLLDFLPQPCPRLLDVGCGEGRFGRFLLERGRVERYVGIDFSQQLLEAAQAGAPGTYLSCDVSRPGCLEGLGRFPAIACLAVMQHLPGRGRRVRLLGEMGRHLTPGGRIFLSTWQFLESERQRRKIAPWEAADIDPAAVEENDYLLTWRSGGFGLRYVTYIDEAETAALAQEAGLRLVAQYRSDGQEGDLNLYTVLAAEAG